MKALRPPREDESAESGFDRRDFAPTGTRFPLQQPSRQSRTSGGVPRWVRPVLVVGGILAVIALVVVLAVALLTRDAVPDAAPDGTTVAADPTDGADGGGAPDPQGVVSADAGAADAAVRPGTTTPGDGPVDRMIPAELHGAASFAVQFANTYLNYDEAIPEVRARALQAYLAPDLDPQLGWSGAGRQLAVMTLALDARTRQDGQVSVTVAAQVTGAEAPRWIYLAVPLAQDDRGRWAVVAPPAFVPRPLPGRPVVPDAPPVDTELSVSLQQGVAALFTAYGSQAGVLVDGVTAPSADIRGLEGQYTFLRLADLRVHAGGDDARTASARVVWDNELTGGSVEQRYTLRLVEAGGRWLVTAVEPG